MILMITFTHPSTKRLLLTLLLPPLWGTVAVLGMMMLTEPHAFIDEELPPHTMLAMSYLGAVMLCLFPGILFWQVFEIIWRKRRDWTERWTTYTGIGALLGLFIGIVGSVLIGMAIGTLEAALLLLPLIGALAGLLTSWPCLQISRSRTE